MNWRRRLDQTIQILSDRETTFFILISSLVGLAVGVGTWLLVFTFDLIHEGFEWVTHRVGADGSWWFFDGSWFWLITVPTGMILAWGIAQRLAPEVKGDGVPEAIVGLAVKGGYLSTRTIPLKILATSFTLGGGGSAGREGPIVQIGSAIGSSIARRFGLGEDQVRSLLAAGAGAGIGASFNAPMAGMLFAMEVILHTFSVKHLSAVVVASVIAAVTSQELVGEELSIQAAVFRLNDPRELLLYAGLAILIVAAAVLFLRVIGRMETVGEWLNRKPFRQPLVMGLAVGVIGMIEPRALGTGQDFLTNLLGTSQFDVTGNARLMWWVLAGLALAKIVATSTTITGGGSGGAFMPSLFIGAALGTGFAQLFEGIWTVSVLNPGAFAVVGMAAMFAAVARAPLTAILIVFEVTGAREYSLVLPLMLAATVASFLTDRFHRESVYTMPLARRGIRLTQTSEVDLLDTVLTREVMAKVEVVAQPDWSLAEAQHHMTANRYHGLAVVDDEEELVGIITVSDIVRAGGANPQITVEAAMTAKPVTVSPTTPVSHALERMAVLGVGRLPVVSDEDSSKLVGIFRRETAVRAYHHALGASTDYRLIRERLQQRTDPGALYYDLRVPADSVADGKMVREIAWPEGSTLVSVRRGREVLVPTGGTVIKANDVITAFGTHTARRRMIERLHTERDDPTAEVPIISMEKDK